MEGVEWENKTGSDPKNWPWSYHNGGHWPSLLWFFGSSILLHERLHPNADVLLMSEMTTTPRRVLLEPAQPTATTTVG